MPLSTGFTFSLSFPPLLSLATLLSHFASLWPLDVDVDVDVDADVDVDVDVDVKCRGFGESWGELGEFKGSWGNGGEISKEPITRSASSAQPAQPSPATNLLAIFGDFASHFW